MERYMDTDKMRQFEIYLRDEEKSQATIGKYMHDVNCFAAFIGQTPVCKENVLAYKARLGQTYAVSSANSMLAAMNAYLRFCGWGDMCVKQFRVQRQVYCAEEKELTRAEYMRLLATAEKQQNKRLHLLIQTICATGIRVSELQYVTVEALRRGEITVDCKGKHRRVFLVSALRKKLLQYAKEQKIKTGEIFVTKNGKTLSRCNIWREMKALCTEARVHPDKVFPHNLRHLFAHTFYSIEKDIAKLADVLGHANINTTRIYIMTTGAEHRRKLEKMHLII